MNTNEKFEIIPLNINSDLHNHTRGSDGRQSSIRFLLRAYHNNKNIVAITDHDSINGIKNLEDDLYSLVETIRADKSYNPTKIEKIINMLENIKVLKGTELITSYNGVIIEVLGYNFDIDKMGQEISKLKSTISKKTYEALYEGFSKTISEKNLVFNKEVLDEAFNKIKIEGKGGVVGPFFNELYSHEENRHLLEYIDENGNFEQASTLKLFINKHLYNKQSPFFVDMSKTRPSYQDTIDSIHKCGGIASLAHPGRYTDKFDVLANMDDMISCGLDMIEVFYPDHSYEFRQELLSKVKEHGLKASGGSDDHHSIKEGIQYDIGRVYIPNIPETDWIETSIESGLDLLNSSEKMKNAIAELKKLKEQRIQQKSNLNDERTSNQNIIKESSDLRDYE